MSLECSLATIRSLSPLATETGILICDRSSAGCSPALVIARTCARPAYEDIGLSRSDVRSASRSKWALAASLPFVVRGKQEVAWVLSGQERLGVGTTNGAAYFCDFV